MPTVPKGYKKAQSNFYKAKDIAEICEISVSKAYKIIAQLNAELTQMGKCTLRGKVNRRFFEERFLNI